MRTLRSRGVYAGILLLVAAGLMLLSLSGLLRPAQGLALRPIEVVQSWLSSRYLTIRDSLTAPRDVATLRQQNSDLQAQVAALQREIISLREKAAQADILGALLNYARTQPENRYLATNVVGRDASPFLRSIWIASGSDDKVERGMPVVTESGLVGRVSDVYATMSRVQVITDPQAAVNIRLQNSRADGVTSAQPNGELRVEQINQAANVVPNELVLTSGLGGGYPPDIILGQVLSVRRRDYELFQQAVIRPAVDFENLEIVLVITSFHALPVTPSGS